MNNYKQIETAAAACRAAQLALEDYIEAMKAYEHETLIRVKTLGFISAAIDSMILSKSNLQFCADRLYKALHEHEIFV